MRRLPTAALVSLLVMLAACSGNQAPGPVSRSPSSSTSAGSVSTPATPPSKSPSTGDVPRVAIVVLENRGFGEVLGDPNAPFIAHLASTYALATNSYAVSHPSLPNYLALIAGSTFGIRTDKPDHLVSEVNLVDQLEQAGLTWTAYVEGLPSVGSDVTHDGRYAKKHNPFMFFDDIAGSPARRSHVVPLDGLDSDISKGSLPDFIWISPDLCHDGHDCALSSADDFLARELPPLMGALGPGGVLVITWDEAKGDSSTCCGLSGSGGGHIATIVAGPGAAKGVRSERPYNHYSVLRTIETLFGLEPLRGAADARAMSDLLA